MRISNLPIETLQIILKERTCDLVSRLNLPRHTIDYIRRTIKKGIARVDYSKLDINVTPQKITNKVIESRPWSRESDNFLLKESGKDLKHIARFLRRSLEDVEARLEYLIKIEQQKHPIEQILANHPNLLPGQIEQARSIYKYSPAGVAEYCKVVSAYKNRRTELNKTFSKESWEQLRKKLQR
jgi:DNA-directed RNA polymerase subunit F